MKGSDSSWRSTTDLLIHEHEHPARSFAYDATGNTTSDSEGYTATYNLENRLETLKKGKTTATYTYDAFGQRVRKTTGTSASTVLFVYDLKGQLLGEYDEAGQALREYVWLDDVPVAVFTPTATPEPAVYFIHTDHLNTPRVIVDRNNAIRWRWLSEPFGINAAETNPSGLGDLAFNLRMPGQYFDQESGLFYNYFRNYDPSRGAYTQSDPIGLAGGINTYAYVGGNPLSYTDPLGLWRNPSDIYDDAMRDARRSGLPGPHNGSQDAFRHCLASCEMARENTGAAAQCLGWANEKRGDWLHNQQRGERQMDDFNNSMGFYFGRTAQSYQACQAACIGAATSGGLRTYQPGTTPGYWY